MKCVIKNGTIIAHDCGEHRILWSGQVSFEGNRITYVGPVRPESADRVVEAQGKLVMPGLVDTHMHSGTQVGERVIPDRGRRDFFQAGYLNVWAVPESRAGAEGIEDPAVGGRYAFLELLRSGVTTAVAVGGGCRELAEVALEVGIRAYLGHGYVTGRHILDEGGRLSYDWRPNGDTERLERAVKFIEWVAEYGEGRLLGMLFPMQVDTCSEELLRSTAEAADDCDVPIQIHAGQNLHEFHEVMRRWGRTPVEVLWDTGILGEGCILGHAALTTAHPFTHLPDGNDLDLIAGSGATVAHCPLVLARRGNALHSLSRYRNAGINVALGTDTYPRDMISEMRLAGLISKIVDHSYRSGSAKEVFDSATVGGARALGREDIGRIAVGAKADIVMLDLQKMRIGPYRDPVQALVNCGTSDDVVTVVVDGQFLIDGGEFLSSDAAGALLAADAFASVAWKQFQDWHIGVPVDEYAPQTYSRFGE